MTTMTWKLSLVFPDATLSWTDGALDWTGVIPEMRKAVTDEIDRMVAAEELVTMAPMAKVIAGLDDPLEAWATITDVVRRWFPSATIPPVPPRTDTPPLDIDPEALRH